MERQQWRQMASESSRPGHAGLLIIKIIISTEQRGAVKNVHSTLLHAHIIVGRKYFALVPVQFAYWIYICLKAPFNWSLTVNWDLNAK